MVYVGIDVAKDKHDCFIVNSDGRGSVRCVYHTEQHGWF